MVPWGRPAEAEESEVDEEDEPEPEESATTTVAATAWQHAAAPKFPPNERNPCHGKIGGRKCSLKWGSVHLAKPFAAPLDRFSPLVEPPGSGLTYVKSTSNG